MLRDLYRAQRKVDFTDKDKLDEKTLQAIDGYDKKMLDYIGRLYSVFQEPRIDLIKLDSTIQALANYNESNQYLYLDSLLHPERNRDSKIPSPIPVPSCSFQLHNTITLTTNSSGNLLGCFNPFFLYQAINGGVRIPVTKEISMGGNTFTAMTINNLSSFFYCNDDTLDGRTVLDASKINSANFSQGIPNVYDQYRLVSASLVVKYIGRLDIASGVIGGAIAYDEYNTVGAYCSLYSADETAPAGYSRNEFLSKYTNFDTIIDSFYHQENLCLEGLREIYFPLDNKFEEYIKLMDANSLIANTNNTPSVSPGYIPIQTTMENYTSGFNFLFYVLGATPNSACFKVDIYCNFECLPNSTFLNYMPVQINHCSISNEQKAMSIKKAQERPIMKVSDSPQETRGSAGNFFSRLAKKVGSVLPSIGSLIKYGLVTAIPGLKPGLALAGAMIGQQTKMEEDVE